MTLSLSLLRSDAFSFQFRAEENRAVLSIQGSVGTPQFNPLQAVCKSVLNFVRVFLQSKLEGPFLHICLPMTIEKLPLDFGFCDTSKHFYPIRYEGFCLCQRPKMIVTSAWKFHLPTAIPNIRIGRAGSLRDLETYG